MFDRLIGFLSTFLNLSDYRHVDVPVIYMRINGFEARWKYSILSFCVSSIMSALLNHLSMDADTVTGSLRRDWSRQTMWVVGVDGWTQPGEHAAKSATMV